MAGAEPGLSIGVTEDRRSVAVTLLPASGGAGSATLSVEQLTAAIRSFGLARQHMLHGRPPPPLEGQEVYAIYDANWYVAPGPQLGGSALVFEHPMYGPLAFVVPPAHAAKIARLLTVQGQVAVRASTAAE